jgi:hypothetical protein
MMNDEYIYKKGKKATCAAKFTINLKIYLFKIYHIISAEGKMLEIKKKMSLLTAEIHEVEKNKLPKLPQGFPVFSRIAANN